MTRLKAPREESDILALVREKMGEISEALPGATLSLVLRHRESTDGVVFLMESEPARALDLFRRKIQSMTDQGGPPFSEDKSND